MSSPDPDLHFPRSLVVFPPFSATHTDPQYSDIKGFLEKWEVLTQEWAGAWTHMLQVRAACGESLLLACACTCVCVCVECAMLWRAVACCAGSIRWCVGQPPCACCADATTSFACPHDVPSLLPALSLLFVISLLSFTHTRVWARTLQRRVPARPHTGQCRRTRWNYGATWSQGCSGSCSLAQTLCSSKNNNSSSSSRRAQVHHHPQQQGHQHHLQGQHQLRLQVYAASQAAAAAVVVLTR